MDKKTLEQLALIFPMPKCFPTFLLFLCSHYPTSFHQFEQKYAHKHTPTNMYAHTHTHTHKHMRAHTSLCAHAHTQHTHACKHAAGTCADAHMHAPPPPPNPCLAQLPSRYFPTWPNSGPSAQDALDIPLLCRRLGVDTQRHSVRSAGVYLQLT